VVRLLFFTHTAFSISTTRCQYHAEKYNHSLDFLCQVSLSQNSVSFGKASSSSHSEITGLFLDFSGARLAQAPLEGYIIYRKIIVDTKVVLRGIGILLLLNLAAAAFGQNAGQFDIAVKGTGSARSITIIKYKGKETNVVIPDRIDRFPVTVIGKRAFDGFTEITSVTLPEGITSIEEMAFFGCAQLANVTLPSSLTFIGNWAFGWCKSLGSITIPPGVTAIGDYTFSRCARLTSITLPPGITLIGENAFSRCTTLSSINFPEGLTSIGDWAFFMCFGLTSLGFPANLAVIGENAFSECNGVNEITISRKTRIGSSAFPGRVQIKYSD
jgi:hypothetical protein